MGCLYSQYFPAPAASARKQGLQCATMASCMYWSPAGHVPAQRQETLRRHILQPTKPSIYQTPMALLYVALWYLHGPHGGHHITRSVCIATWLFLKIGSPLRECLVNESPAVLGLCWRPGCFKLLNEACGMASRNSLQTSASC